MFACDSPLKGQGSTPNMALDSAILELLNANISVVAAAGNGAIRACRTSPSRLASRSSLVQTLLVSLLF